MTKDRYQIITLDGARILNRRSVAIANEEKSENSFHLDVDLSGPSMRSSFVKSVDLQNDCALFFQIKKVLEEHKRNILKSSIKSDPENADILEDYLNSRFPDGQEELKEWLVFVDFSELFSKSDDGLTVEKTAALREILENGIKISFDGFEIRHFTVFDKSSGMSKKCVLSFIDSNIFKEVDRRIRLDINFGEISVIPSKYYAYRGLYMSDGIRIECPGLNENNVIVLPDDNTLRTGEKIITASLKVTKKGKEEHLRYSLPRDIITEGKDIDGRVIEKRADKLQITEFDGEGLISPEYAKWLNKELKNGDPFLQNKTSFQIRIPFGKGVLHTVDFKSFFAEKLDLPEDDMTSLVIKDAFGIERNIMDADIILTKSMLKAAGWLKKWSEILMESALFDISEYETAEDPMKYYFSEFHRYQHAIYVTRTNKEPDPFGIKMNYQFLSTIDLKEEDIRRLVDRHFETTQMVRYDDETARRRLLGVSDFGSEKLEDIDNDPETSDIDEENILSGTDESADIADITNEPAWKYALRKNPAFLHGEPLIREMIKDMSRSMIDDAILGRIEVEGMNCLLSDDLMAFLIKIVSSLRLPAEVRARSECAEKVSDFDRIIKETKKSLVKERLYEDRFYVAGHAKYGLDFRKYYAVLRNPHLSKNEQCALRPYTPSAGSLYERYFGHLSGVLMIPYNSNVAAVLGGADFDGDLVKLILDRDISDAVFHGAYRRKENGRGYERKYPIVSIPGTLGKSRKITSNITLDDICNTFSSKVGQISNIAFRFSKTERSDLCPVCTIATGLEIDATKTGMHPDFKGLKEILKEVSDGPADYYLNIKDIVKKTQTNLLLQQIKEDKKTGKECYTACIKKGKNRKTGEDIYEDIFIAAVTPDTFNADKDSVLDILPYYYLKELERQKSGFKNDAGARESGNKYSRCKKFSFNEDKDIIDDRAYAAARIILAYKKMNKFISYVNYTRKNYNSFEHFGIVKSLVEVRYDTDADGLLFDEGREWMDIMSALDFTWAWLRALFEDSDDIICEEKDNKADQAERVVETLKAKWKEWMYAHGREERATLLREILGESLGKEDIPYAAEAILCDTYDNGYQILKFILRDIRNELEAGRSEEDRLERWENRTGSSLKNSEDCDDMLFNRMFSCYSKEDTRAVTKGKMTAACREELKRLFDGDMQAAAECVWKESRRIDSGHRFFWNVFTAEDIAPLLQD